MRKRKENLTNPATIGDSQIRDAVETANEERADAIGGETSTEGVGRGFDAEGADASEQEKAEASADGPVAGEMTDPPTTKRGVSGKKKSKKDRIHPANSPSNHAAANSSKTY